MQIHQWQKIHEFLHTWFLVSKNLTLKQTKKSRIEKVHGEIYEFKPWKSIREKEGNLPVGLDDCWYLKVLQLLVDAFSERKHIEDGNFNGLDQFASKGYHLSVVIFMLLSPKSLLISTLTWFLLLTLLYKGRGSNGILFWNAYFAPLPFLNYKRNVKIKIGTQRKLLKINLQHTLTNHLKEETLQITHTNEKITL